MKRKLERLEAPFIKFRNHNKEINLRALGTDPLPTVILYTGIEEGDIVSTQWWGANDEGDFFDDLGTHTVGSEEVVSGLVVHIDNYKISMASGGEAFYSYRVNNKLDSLRVLSFIGMRDKLPVALAVESHGLMIKPGDLDAAGVTFVVAPYQALAVGDKITFTFKGFDEDGIEDKVIIETLTVTKAHLNGKALTFNISKNNFRFIDPGRAEVYYQVDFGDEKTAKSPLQKFAIDSDAKLPGYLPEPMIVGHVPGEKLRPDKFREGLTIRVEGYTDMATSDRVTLCWRSPVREFLQTVRVDASTGTVGDVAFHIPIDYLLENQGLDVTLFYLFANEGVGQRSLELSVSIETMRELSPPLVMGAAPDPVKDSGTLPADEAFDGVWVRVPNVLQIGERARVEWRGLPSYGEYTADTPAGSDPLLFHIPAQYVPANMGRGALDESRRFEVAYWVIGDSEESESDPYNLRIKPFPTHQYPQISCKQVASGKLSLANVPDDGADLELSTWYYGREGNFIDLSISGISALGAIKETIRDASQPVSESEANNGIKTKLDKAILEKLQFDESFTLYVRLSFDGGGYYITFPVLSPTLVP